MKFDGLLHAVECFQLANKSDMCPVAGAMVANSGVPLAFDQFFFDVLKGVVSNEVHLLVLPFGPWRCLFIWTCLEN